MINFAASALALLLVLVLAYYVIKAGARLNGITHRGNSIRVLETAAVGSRERLVIVSYNNQRYLLGVTSHNVSVIDTLADSAVSTSDSLNSELTDKLQPSPLRSSPAH